MALVSSHARCFAFVFQLHSVFMSFCCKVMLLFVLCCCYCLVWFGVLCVSVCEVVYVRRSLSSTVVAPGGTGG